MDLTMSAARTEFEQIAFSAVKDLLNKTGAHSASSSAAAAMVTTEGCRNAAIVHDLIRWWQA
jgi:hypothetical protein